jgi:hypothetical protein
MLMQMETVISMQMFMCCILWKAKHLNQKPHNSTEHQSEGKDVIQLLVRE